MLRTVLAPRLLGQTLRCLASTSRSLVSAAAEAAASSHVPEGHKDSDLRPEACNIGLNRRRTLLLRKDVQLYTPQGSMPVSEVLEGVTSVLFGVPDMGKVCSEKHVPGYLSHAKDLQKAGVNKIICVAVSEPAALKEWASKVGVNGGAVTAYADKTGAFSRMLGVERGAVDSPGPRTHRYSALVEDGLLIKMMVETSPGEVEQSSAENMLRVIKDLKALKTA